MDRRSLIFGALATLYPGVGFGADTAFNLYATGFAKKNPNRAYLVKSGDTWRSVFGAKAEVARRLNRQNLALEAGQLIIRPQKGDTLDTICPFSIELKTNKPYRVIVSPRRFAWALYQGGVMTHWGPAVCGGSWCSDVGRSCQTPSGQFSVTEAAGPDRRSSSYPLIGASEGKGALMPYFLRLTSYGVGMHARYIRGQHETHGCIGLFYEDAKWLNQFHRQQGKLSVKVESYGDTEYL